MSEPRGSNGTRPQPGQKESTKTKKRPEMKAKTPVSESARAIATSCLEARPRLLPKDLGEIMRPDPAVEFSKESPEIETGAMKLYDASNEKEDYENFNPDLNTPVVKEFKALWKVCLRVWRVSPIALMSPMCGLKYFPLGSGRKRANQAVFSPEFSKLFATLITHPC